MLVNKSKRGDDKLQRSLPQLSITAPSPRSSKYQRPVDSLLDNHPSPIATNAKMNQRYQSMVNHRQQQVNGIKYASCSSENVNPQSPTMRARGKQQVKVERNMAELQLMINQANQLLMGNNDE